MVYDVESKRTFLIEEMITLVLEIIEEEIDEKDLALVKEEDTEEAIDEDLIEIMMIEAVSIEIETIIGMIFIVILIVILIQDHKKFHMIRIPFISIIKV